MDSLLTLGLFLLSELGDQILFEVHIRTEVGDCLLQSMLVCFVVTNTQIEIFYYDHLLIDSLNKRLHFISLSELYGKKGEH